jgi:hypothetical protein
MGILQCGMCVVFDFYCGVVVVVVVIVVVVVVVVAFHILWPYFKLC